MKFLERTYSELGRGENSRLLSRVTNSLLKGKFLNRIQVEKLVFILKETRVTLVPSNFYMLVASDADITPFLPQIKRF